MKYIGKYPAEVRQEVFQLARLSECAEGVGDCLSHLHFWCEDGVPEGVEGYEAMPGVHLYTLRIEARDIVCYVGLKGGFLTLLAIGRISIDDRTHAVFMLAFNRCKRL